MDYSDIQNDRRLADTLTLVDKAETSIIEFFSTQKYKTGDVIPKEMELAGWSGNSKCD